MPDTNQKKHLLRELYPYDIKDKKNAALRKGLKEYAFLIQGLNEAARNFLDGNLEKFDALVGENACQIRAVKIAILAAKNNTHFQNTIQLTTSIQKKLSILLEDANLASLMIKDVNLEEILSSKDLDVVLSQQEFFLFQSFLLCEMKEPTFDGDFIPELVVLDKSAAKKLKKFHSEVSNSFLGFLLNQARTRIAKRSVKFVKKAALNLNDPYIIKMTSDDFKIEHNELDCIPMFWGYKALIGAALKESIPLVAHIQFVKGQSVGYKVVEEEFLYFKTTNEPNGPSYIQCSQNEIDACTPACILQGVVVIDTETKFFDKAAWKERIAKYSITDIILAVAADHRQYPNKTSNVHVHDSEYENYKSIASNQGFSINNPNKCLHFLSSTVLSCG